MLDKRPRFSEEAARRLVFDLYGLRTATTALPSDRDQNFFLKNEEGENLVLKIANAAEREDVLEFQNKAMNHLAEQEIVVGCPHVYLTSEGKEIATISGESDARHYVRVLTYLPGMPLAKVNPHTPGLLQSLGHFLGNLDRAFEGFIHSGAYRKLDWDLKHAEEVILRHREHIVGRERQELVDFYLQQYQKDVVPLLPELRESVIHNDANDYNVLVSSKVEEVREVVGLIDFGDMIHTYTVAESAIAAAYAMMDKADPIAAAEQIVEGYHNAYPLTELELAVLYPMICMRLCTSVAMSAYQQKQEPDNEYLSISERPAWALLKKLSSISPELVQYRFRHACGLIPCPQTPIVEAWLNTHRNEMGSVITPSLDTAKHIVFDLSIQSPDIADLPDLTNPKVWTQRLFGRMWAEDAQVGIGRYNEARACYLGNQFKVNGGQERRTIHLGVDLFQEAGSPVFAPLDGVVHSFKNNDGPQDYGPTLILEHILPDEDVSFYTLYGHLSLDSIEGLTEGQAVQQGDRVGDLGEPSVNGGWPPHLHFQIITDLLGARGDFIGVAEAGQRAVWMSLSPYPGLMLPLPETARCTEARSTDELQAARSAHLGPSLSLSYKNPLHIVRGLGARLYDTEGRAYLDCVNNVCHVGHCHPQVVRAGQRQMMVLNTNTRYLHEHILRYAERLAATMPPSLSVCYFVNSGSEANDLALRLARTCTGEQDTIVLDSGYHGNLTSLVEISPYKFDGRGGKGAPNYVHKALMPDLYRGSYRRDDPNAAQKYAGQVQELIDRVRTYERGIAAFIGESLLGCGGQIVLPEGYLEAVYKRVHAAGGLCIADEVQVGFGRVGTHFWGFETQGVVPDIVTLGKPIGNGHPLGAVVTTPEIAAYFNNGMEYFNTFGGNPVSCAVGLAVLDVIEQENLQQNALTVGNRLMEGLRDLQTRFPLIGEVRGMGLFIGIELVRDRETLEPAAKEASYLVNRMRERGILLSTDGPLHNVIKIKPPIVFAAEDADLLVRTLDEILREDVLQPQPTKA